jgi:hypothetical protein
MCSRKRRRGGRNFWSLVVISVLLVVSVVAAYMLFTRQPRIQEYENPWNVYTGVEPGKLFASVIVDTHSEPPRVVVRVKSNHSEPVFIYGVVIYYRVDGDIRRIDVVINETVEPGEERVFTRDVPKLTYDVIVGLYRVDIVTSIGRKEVPVHVPV